MVTKVAIARVNSEGKIERIPVLPNQRLAYIKNFRYICADCKVAFPEEELEIDHIYPASRGGTSDKSNLQVLCKNCHIKKRGIEKKLPQRGIQLQFKLGHRNWAGAKIENRLLAISD